MDAGCTSCNAFYYLYLDVFFGPIPLSFYSCNVFGTHFCMCHYFTEVAIFLMEFNGIWV